MTDLYREAYFYAVTALFKLLTMVYSLVAGWWLSLHRYRLQLPRSAKVEAEKEKLNNDWFGV